MAKYTYRFDVISKITGKQEPFTGIFDTLKEANEWFDKYAYIWIDKGYQLILEKNKIYYESKNRTETQRRISKQDTLRCDQVDE